jgi:hypothetical protein
VNGTGVSVSLVFDGDLNTMNVEQKAQFTYTAIGELVDRFDNVSRDDVKSATLSAGSILLVVEFYPGTVSVDEAHTVVSDANTGNPIYASAGNITHSTSSTFIDKYTESPTAAPTSAPTLGSWCQELRFGETCSELKRPIFESTVAGSGTGYDKMDQCTLACETHNNVGCCQFDLLSSTCRGFPQTWNGTTLPSTLPRAASMCIAGPRWRTTTPPETTSGIDEDNVNTAANNNNDPVLGSAQTQYLLLGCLAAVALLCVLLLVRASMKMKVHHKEALKWTADEDNGDILAVSPKHMSSEDQEAAMGSLMPPWRAQFENTHFDDREDDDNNNNGDNRGGWGERKSVYSVQPRLAHVDSEGVDDDTGDWDDAFEQPHRSRPQSVGGPRLVHADSEINSEVDYDDDYNDDDVESDDHASKGLGMGAQPRSMRFAASAADGIESRLPAELHKFDSFLMDRAFERTGLFDEHDSKSQTGRQQQQHKQQQHQKLKQQQLPHPSYVRSSSGSELQGEFKNMDELAPEIFEIFNGCFDERSLGLLQEHRSDPFGRQPIAVRGSKVADVAYEHGDIDVEIDAETNRVRSRVLDVTYDSTSSFDDVADDATYEHASRGDVDDDDDDDDDTATNAASHFDDPMYEHAMSAAFRGFSDAQSNERPSKVLEPVYSMASDIDVYTTESRRPPIGTGGAASATNKTERVSKVHTAYAHASHGDIDYGSPSDDDEYRVAGADDSDDDDDNNNGVDIRNAWEGLAMFDGSDAIDVQETMMSPPLSMAMKRAKNMSRKLQPTHSTGSSASLEL